MTELPYPLLRFRLLRWPYYRFVWTRNVVLACGRWMRNYSAWLVRAVHYRSLFLVQWLRFAARWFGLRTAWLGRLLHNLVWAMGRVLANHLHVWVRRAEAPFRSREAAAQARAQVVRHWRQGVNDPVPVAAAQPRQPVADLVVVVHAHHLDVLPRIMVALERLAPVVDEPLRVLLTVTRGREDAVRDLVSPHRLQVQVIPVENRGRDVLPFLQLAQRGLLADVRLVLKLHTKVSGHRDDGHDWRDNLVDGLTDPARYPDLLRRARSGEEFVAVPKAQILGARDWGRNVRSTARLAASLGILHMPFRFRFPAGTMFWITHGLVERLATLPLERTDFEPEPLPLDGALPHAVERVIGIAAGAYGSGVIATEQA